VIELSGWGRYPAASQRDLSPTGRPALPGLLAERSGVIARGNGRAYGDAAIGEQVTLSARGLDRMLAFDPASGRLTVEAGVLLSDILPTFVRRGFFPPVVPGTKLVTVGGMIATDVHGKNHHRDGGFGDHVEAFTLLLPAGRAVACSRAENPDLFAAVDRRNGPHRRDPRRDFRLKPVETGWMRQRTVVADALEGADGGPQDSADATYSVAWIDCLAAGASLGRSLVFVAEHATRADLAGHGADGGGRSGSKERAAFGPDRSPGLDL
jgi:hypothetical protein